MPSPQLAARRRYLFFSHDGFGLGHFRRNCLIAGALLRRSPEASVVLVTGLPVPPGWVDSSRVGIVRVPPLLKDSKGGYQAIGSAFEEAIAGREVVFAALAAAYRPHVVVVDRHPYGTAGELRPGLLTTRDLGARMVLGLRDVLDEPGVVACELAGQGWEGATELYDEALVYGAPHICDHQAEYGLPLRPWYCGWVVDRPPPTPRRRHLLAVAAGGGGDGEAVFRLGIEVVERRRRWRGHMAAGPFADAGALRQLVRRSRARRRLRVDTRVEDCGRLFARSAAVVQMAGYNSTAEALAAGQRPILVPRRSPRLEQAIRAERLAALDLCDVVPEHAHPTTVAELLDGAERAAGRLEELAVGALL